MYKVTHQNSKTSGLLRFGMFHAAWVVGIYSCSPPDARAIGNKSTRVEPFGCDTLYPLSISLNLPPAPNSPFSAADSLTKTLGTIRSVGRSKPPLPGSVRGLGIDSDGLTGFPESRQAKQGNMGGDVKRAARARDTCLAAAMRG